MIPTFQKNPKMDNLLDRCHILPNQDNEMLSKRRKLTQLRTPPLQFPSPYSAPHNAWKVFNMKRDLAALHIKLYHTTAAFTHFQRQKKRIENVLEEQTRSLEIEMEMNREMIKQMEVHLAAEIRCYQHAHQPPVTSELEGSQQKTKMEDNVIDLSTKNTGMIPSSFQDSSICLRARGEDLKVSDGLDIAEEGVKGNLEHMLGKDWLSESLHQLQNVPFNRGLQPQEFNLERIPSRGGQILPQSDHLVETVYGKNEESLAELQGDESRESGTCSAAWTGRTSCLHQSGGFFKQVDDPNERNEIIRRHKELNKREAEERRRRGITVGGQYILPSDDRFFNINWEAYYTHRNSHENYCNICLEMKNSKVKMQDHIWIQHCGGRFKCPWCLDSSYQWRDRVARHVRAKHADLLPPKK
ncbi:uncharacterized protein LOC107047768 [Diachasma alloeum]|uniref:uncharacterized protein LOC107047768 n=1 Tax=Diachasma alloeum TaxID=454923 RepID=UPI00073839DD|nr:uncharacterized protein LOC107047768 [Diachasma alloeum]